jgi:ribosomal protein L7/L12
MTNKEQAIKDMKTVFGISESSAKDMINNAQKAYKMDCLAASLLRNARFTIEKIKDN